MIKENILGTFHSVPTKVLRPLGVCKALKNFRGLGGLGGLGGLVLFLALAVTPASLRAQYDMPVSLNPFEVAKSRGPQTISSFSFAAPIPAIALTFDDGPHPKYTPRLLDILKRYGVKATFFVVGRNVERYPDIAQRIAAEGHQIANHTMTHPNLVKLKRKKFDKEIKETNTIIEAYTGKKPTSIRPPYGSLNVKVEAVLKNLYGMNVIMWSVDPEDWKKPGTSEVARRLIAGARPGAILLAHDIHEQTIEAIPEVLSQLLSQGYKFGTIDQLMSLPQVQAFGPATPGGRIGGGGSHGSVIPQKNASYGSAAQNSPNYHASPGMPTMPMYPNQVNQPLSGSETVSGYKVPVLRALPAN
jgi:peptidoglycan/xylan/chitin deacetylase (PgdA/CDA1 family)